MYLEAYRKAELISNKFNLEETNRLNSYDSNYSLFDNCPEALKKCATKIETTNQYYDMKKISKEHANGEPLSISMITGDKTGFRNRDSSIRIELSTDVIERNYIITKSEPQYVFKKEEIGYWRKANQVRKWFVEHIDEFDEGDNGEFYPITKELLQELMEDCQKVLDNHDLAEQIMPSSSGFFFGGTEYDDWYFDGLTETIEICENAIENVDWENEVVIYTESW